MKLFALIKASSGEDIGHDPYSYTPEPDIIGVYKTEEEAKKAMADAIEEILAECDEDEEVIVDDSPSYNVITNTDADWCVVLKLDATFIEM